MNWILPDPSFRAPLEARLQSILSGSDPVDAGALEPPGRERAEHALGSAEGT